MSRIYKDKLHYSARKLDSYNKPFNFVISEREAGKTTQLLATKIYKMWKHHNRPSIILRRNIIDITETYIDDLQDSINDFLPDSSKIKFEYKKGDMKNGVVSVEVEGRPFCRFIALSNPKGRIKSLRYEDPYAIFFDEFIIDTAGGEKYLADEANKFFELYNTFLRFATRNGHTLRCYFSGNPYSLFNPFFSWLNIDITKIKPGAFIVGDQYVLECYTLKQELRDWILARNPLYSFDNSYKRYAFNGEAVNDKNIKVVTKQPDGYRIKWVFRVSQKNLAVYHKAMSRPEIVGYDVGKYWIAVIPDGIGTSKKLYSVDFNNLIENSKLITSDVRAIVYRLKNAIGNRDVSYGSLEAGYLTQAIYTVI